MAPSHRTAVQLLLMILVIATAAGAAYRFAGRDEGSTAEESTSLLDLLEDSSEPRTVPSDSDQPSITTAVQTPPPLVPEIPTGTGSVALPIRVALLSQVPINSVATDPATRCRMPSGRVITDEQVNALLRSDAGGRIRCRGGRLSINASPYRHTVELINRGEGWLAINELDLEPYIASVVGAEMPSYWAAEALKAQAVAARSYALAHLARPASADYHLGDTTRWQAYKGDASRTVTTRDATQATQGIILSYQGGIVESLYAANSAISAEAHGHLGASMSQEGAQNLALKGLKYNEILGHFYRGASLARLRDDGG